MTASDRLAALRRARQRQARIEAATTRAIKAHGGLERAITARQIAAERHDERVARAEALSESETADLARACGSAEAAAEILGWTVREVRRVLKAEIERGAASSERSPNSDRSEVSDALWTIDEVAAYLNVPKGTLYRWWTMGYGPPGKRIGRHLRFRQAK
jgi:excisionase family DNA binding protein